MSSSVNKVIIIGNLGRDPELRHTEGGTAVCNLSIATTRSYFNKSTNERVEETEWHRVVVWDKAAEACDKYLAKGRQVYVEGRLKTSSYEKEGATHYSTDVVADTVQFLGGGGERDGGGRSESRRERRPAPRQAEPEPEDDDIPFKLAPAA